MHSRHSELNESLKRAPTSAGFQPSLNLQGSPGRIRGAQTVRRKFLGKMVKSWCGTSRWSIPWRSPTLPCLWSKPDQLLMLPKEGRSPKTRTSEANFSFALLVWRPSDYGNLVRRSCLRRLEER
ncbi:hypothetical protein RvY_15177 [Ramazzottius varieornatus]|uniref:Uncharacterized protein n=1 Tax=Ramazzottius varieornatus TaxID=947166 RepID=A0A1D1VXG6_RAMVA|nr:hypothetical protein RvY_15177 [Ramazzottius varieornatus]